MSFADDEKLLSEYLEWKATNTQNDLTPASFLVARAEHAAFEKVEAILKLIDIYDALDPEDYTAKDILEDIREAIV